MHADSPRQAHALLQKAVPLMRKMDIAPTPYNYGIWYEYVRQSSPQLNRLMNSTISRLGSLPSFVSKELFHQFLVAEEARYNHEHKDRLHELINHISSSTDAMQSNLQSLNSVVSKSQRVLKRADRHKHIERVVNYLEQGTHKALNDAEQFTQKLTQVNTEIAQLKAELDSMRNNVELDPMTQLLNQRGLERQLYNLLPGAEDDVSLLILDIDHLSTINETFNRRAGNALICHIGKILMDKKPNNSCAARLTGGTFAIALQDTTLDSALRFAENLRAHLNKQRLRSKGGKGIIDQIKVSIGVATIIGEESPIELIARANGYLDNAKRQGRNRTASR